PCSDPCRVHLTLPPAPRLLAPFPYTTLFRSSGHIQHIIDPASNPVITVFIATRAISGKISTRISREIGFDKTFRIAPDGSHLARPGIFNHQIAFSFALQLLTIRIDNRRLYPKERPGCRTRFQISRAWQWRNHKTAGFRLPPGINDGTATFTDHSVIPVPGFRIDRLTHRT